MANKDGIITRRNVIEDEALKWGDEYVKNVQKAINKNDEFVKGIFELSKAYKSIKGAVDNSEFIRAKEEERLQFLKNIHTVKEQEAAEASLARQRKSALQEAKMQLEIEAKKEAATKRNTKLTVDERIQNEMNNKVLKQAALERLGLVGAYQKLSQARLEAKNRLRDLMVTEAENSKVLRDARIEFERLDSAVKKADKAVGDFSKNVGNYPTIGKLAGNLKDLVGAFGVTVGIGAFANALSAAYQTLKAFDQGMADLQAITGASGKDLEFLKKQAIELGKETAGGAIKVVEAYKLIASAKPELLENVEALDAVTKSTLTLAKASGMDLPAAATALTDAMNQFNAPAEKAGEFIDALANGAKYGSAEIPQVTDALLKFGAVAKSSNVNIQESTALIELLAEKGQKGAEAGTALRNVLLRLSAPDALPKEAKSILDKLGISMDTLKDKSLPIQQRFEALKPLLADDSYLVKVFGQENIVAAKNVINHTDRLKDLTDKMYEYGTAQEQAEIRSNTLQGKTERLTATYDSLVLSMNEGKGIISSFFSAFVDGSRKSLEMLIRMNTSWDELYKKAQLQGGEIGKSQFEIFSRGLSPEEVEENFEKIRKAFFENRNKLEEDLKRNEEELAKKNPYALTNPFGKSIKDYKKEIERLKGEISQIDAFLAEKGKFLNPKADASSTSENVEVVQEKLTDKELEKIEKLRMERLKKLFELRKKLADDEFKLEQFRLQALIDINQEYSQEEDNESDNRIEALMTSYQLRETLLENSLRKQLQSLGVYNEKTGEFERELTDIQINEIIRTGKTTEKLTAEQQLMYEQFQKDKTSITKKSADEREKIIESEVNKLKKLNDSIILQNDTELNKALEAENLKFKALTDGQKNIEDATEEHERAVFEIKKYYAKKSLQEQIDAIQKILEIEKQKPEETRISAEKIKEIENNLSKYKRDLSEADNQTYTGNAEKRLMTEQEVSEKMKELSENLSSELINLANSVFEARISNIDYEIQKSDDYYRKLQEAAGNDQRQKDLLTKEAEKKREELEKKKRKEQTKQAIFNKAMAITDIGIKTAQAIIGVWANPGYPMAIPLTVLTALLGTAQTAAVLATPIPKYKDGRKNGPKELAIVGDGGVNEVIKRKTGRVELTPNTDTLVQLYAGDEVYKSTDEYYKAMRAANMASLAAEKGRLNEYQTAAVFDHSYDREMIKEMRLLRKSVDKQKSPKQMQTPDINHFLWKSKNSNWN